MFKKDISPSIAGKLRNVNVSQDDVLLFTDTDIDHLNRYQTLWLAVTKERIFVFTDGASPIEVFNLELRKATEYRCSGVVGAGLLQARVDGMFVVKAFSQEQREMEIGLIRQLADWPGDAQRLISESLMKRYFIHIISAIEDITQFHSYLNFKVETDLGPMEFMLRWQGDLAHDLSMISYSACASLNRQMSPALTLPFVGS